MSARKKWTIGLCIVVGLVFPQTLLARPEINLSNELSFTYNNVTGPGAASSSLSEGGHYLNVLGIFGNGKVSGYDYNFNLGAKATDDRNNDPMTWSLTNFQGRISDNVHTLSIGDVFESFSQYSLGTALKGGSYKYTGQEGKIPEVTILAGKAVSRWDSLWRETKTKAIDRQVYGGRVKHNFTADLWAGLSLVTSRDSERINDTDPLYDNNVYALDLEYRPIPGLVVRAETAFNNTSLSPQEGAAYSNTHGYAYRIEAVGDADPSRVSLEYGKTAPKFVSLLGAATPDREKFKAKWRYKYSKTVTLNTGFLWYRNNLEGQRADGRTDYYKPEAGVTVRRLFGRQYSSADITYKLNLADRNSSTTKVDHVVNLNYKDRFGQLDSDTNLGLTSYETKDLTASRRNEYTFNQSLGSRHTVGMFILKPGLFLGGTSIREELVDEEDKIYEYSLGLGLDVPTMKITSQFKVGQNKLDKATGDDTNKGFANLSVYWRPDFLAKLNEGMFFLRAHWNDFNFTTAARDFRETSVTVGLNIQF